MAKDYSKNRPDITLQEAVDWTLKNCMYDNVRKRLKSRATAHKLLSVVVALAGDKTAKELEGIPELQTILPHLKEIEALPDLIAACEAICYGAETRWEVIKLAKAALEKAGRR